MLDGQIERLGAHLDYRIDRAESQLEHCLRTNSQMISSAIEDLDFLLAVDKLYVESLAQKGIRREYDRSRQFRLLEHARNI